MSKPLSLQSGLSNLLDIPGIGIVLAAGDTPPADAAVGYAPNCLFIHTDGTQPDASIYLNVGTLASANFDAMDLTIIS